MPKGQYDRSHLIGRMRHGCSPPRATENPVFRDDISRGEIRFAAEVVLTRLRGREVPDFAHVRALEALVVMARG